MHFYYMNFQYYSGLGGDNATGNGFKNLDGQEENVRADGKDGGGEPRLREWQEASARPGPSFPLSLPFFSI
jgi:hypothetical protein